MLSLPTRYQLKRLALTPKLRKGRRRHSQDSQFIRTSFENSNYSDAIYGFLRATVLQPDLLTRFDLSGGAQVVDVGAYIGRWAICVADSNDCHVFAFELSPLIQPRLEGAVGGRQDITALPYGLGGSDEIVQINRKELGSSVFSKDADHTETDSADIRDVANVWQELGLSKVALMKINIEGGEYELLERMSQRGLLATVDTFLIQFHEWLPKAHRRRRDIRKQLALTHTLVWDYPFVWELWQAKAPTGAIQRR